MDNMLVIVETHPIQYHGPVWKEATAQGVPLHVIYGADFSVRGHHDPAFNAVVKWDMSLLSGYSYEFLSIDKPKVANNYDEVTTNGISSALDRLSPKALLISGHTHRLDRRTFIEGCLRKIALLYRAEANDSAIRRSLPKSLIRDTYLKFLYSTLNAVLPIGLEACKHYSRLGVPRTKMFFSPYAVDITPFRLSESEREICRTNTRLKHGISERETVVIFSGKLTYRKGVDLLAEAIASFPEETRPTLLLVGDGELRTHIINYTSRLKLILAGFQSQDQLSQYYHSADLLALPSRHSETWGLVVNEAMHHGLPVVVSNSVGCRRDLVESDSTGEVFARGDVQSLTNALKKALGYAKSESTRKRCKAKVSSYSIENAALGVKLAWDSLDMP